MSPLAELETPSVCHPLLAHGDLKHLTYPRCRGGQRRVCIVQKHSDQKPIQHRVGDSRYTANAFDIDSDETTALGSLRPVGVDAATPSSGYACEGQNLSVFLGWKRK